MRSQRSALIPTLHSPGASPPNAACVVSLIVRLVHNAEIIAIEGESYRLKEARERTEQRSRQRRGSKA